MFNNVIEYLVETAEQYPDNIGYVDSNNSITFSQLEKEVKIIATDIIKSELTKKPCVVFLPKGIDCIKAFLGIACSGNFYTPIDVDMPQQRIEKIIDILQPELFITNEENYDCVKAFCRDNQCISPC